MRGRAHRMNTDVSLLSVFNKYNEGRTVMGRVLIAWGKMERQLMMRTKRHSPCDGVDRIFEKY